MAYRATINLMALAGVAKPNPKMGQALGPLGINMMKFCEQFNKRTSHIRGDVPMKVRLVAYTDRTFKFDVKPPQTTWFFKKASGLKVFTPIPGHHVIGTIPIQYLYEIAKIKKQIDPDFKDIELPAILNMVIAQLSTCGLQMIDSTIKPKPMAIKTKI